MSTELKEVVREFFIKFPLDYYFADKQGRTATHPEELLLSFLWLRGYKITKLEPGEVVDLNW